MELNTSVLRQLADLEQGERTILSAYLDLAGGWEPAERALEVEARRLRSVLDETEGEAFDVALELAGEELSRRRSEQVRAPGLALFVSPDDGVQHSVQLPSAPQPMVTFDHHATVFPLALQLDEFEPVGVILVDASGARILVAAGDLRQEVDSYRANIKNLVKVGGWSQMRYQRRRGEQVKRAASEIVEAAQEAFSDAGVQRVLLAGRHEMMTALEEAMPAALREQVIGTLAWDLESADDDLLTEARPILEAAEREQECALLERFKAEVRRGGLAAAGLEETRRALEWGAVEVLLMAPACCGQQRDEVASLAATTAARVEVVPEPSRLLAEHGGVGALLRFPVYDPEGDR